MIPTSFKGEKATHQAAIIISDRTGWLADVDGQTLTGYEIHAGRTGGSDAQQWLSIQRRDGNGTAVLDGAISSDGRIWGCYLHGLFDFDRFRRAWLESLGWQSDSTTDGIDGGLIRSFDKLADVLEEAVDMDELEGIIWK